MYVYAYIEIVYLRTFVYTHWYICARHEQEVEEPQRVVHRQCRLNERERAREERERGEQRQVMSPSSERENER
jgi:hypothetical protein